MLPIHNEQLSYTMLADDKWCVIVPDTSPLYQPGLKEIEKFPYPLNLLKNEKYVLTTSQSGIRKQANEFLKHLDIKADVVMESQNISTAAALARKGMGLTFLPKSALNNSELMDSYKYFLYRNQHRPHPLFHRLQQRKDTFLSRLGHDRYGEGIDESLQRFHLKISICIRKWAPLIPFGIISFGLRQQKLYHQSEQRCSLNFAYKNVQLTHRRDYHG